MSEAFQIDVQQVNDKTAIINLNGDVTIYSDAPIHDAYDALCAAGIRNLIFNFDEKNMVYTPGLAVIVNLLFEAQQKGQRMIMAIPNLYLQRIFALVGISQYATVFNSLDEAKAQILGLQ